MNLLFSVVIPTCNRPELLKLCLERLNFNSQSFSSKMYEVIVSDDSTDENTKELIDSQFSWVIWVEGPKKGPAANRNNGASYSNGRWLVFTDDDCIPQIQWLESYYKALLNSNAKVLEGSTSADRKRLRYDEEAPVNLSGGYLWSCNFAIEKELFSKIGGFNEDFPFAALEDVDFHLRVKAKTEVKFVSGAIVIHPWRRVWGMKMLLKRRESYLVFLKLHPDKIIDNYFLVKIKALLKFLILDTFNVFFKYKLNGFGFYCTKLFFIINSIPFYYRREKYIQSFKK